MIIKNRANLPDDIQKLNAIDCPTRHHLYECVVFPAQGQRLHSNEINGTDLDDDEVRAFQSEEFQNIKWNCVSSLKS